ncbi:MAG: hypothetical protein L0213_06930, partial [Candidatus Dadabacteria bacterium]|nr:hypothetical protein [Candidatus Dadabacteria bacterium]
MKNFIIVLSLGIVIGVMFMSAINCGKDKAIDEENVVARVGDAYLTIDDVDKIDQMNRMRKMPVYPSKEDIMEEWIASEVIYQQSEKDKIYEDPDVEWRLYNARKSILINAFWQIKVYDKYPEPSDEEALEYYEEVKDRDYKVTEDNYWIRRIAVGSKDKVDEVRAKLAQGEDFAGLATKVS